MLYTKRIAPPLVLLFLTAVWLLGCGADDPRGATAPTLETQADSVAMQLYEAHGGAEAWASVPYLRFDFGVESEGETQVAARHLWNRETGDYRLEWEAGPDSQYVALFDVEVFGEHAAESTPEAGQVYLNGEAVDAEENASLLEQAHRRFVNDTYWLLAPVKVFDPGVNRSYEADSSDAQHDVLHLTFGEVGLTPGDEYWLYVNRETGRVDRWAFHLQHMEDDEPARAYEWTDYLTFDVPAGTIHLAARKAAQDGESAIVFPSLDAPESVSDDAFSTPDPQL